MPYLNHVYDCQYDRQYHGEISHMAGWMFGNFLMHGHFLL